jgi:hypothetical protein
MLNKILSKIKGMFKSGFCIRRVICCVPGSHPLWERSEKLLCPHLRQDIERYVGDGKYKTSWIARDSDPCPMCDRLNCHNNGKVFHGILEDRLIIEKAHCI